MDMDDVFFESDDGEFVIYADCSWSAMQDGKVVHGSAFSKADLSRLSEETLRLERSRIGLYDNDRYGAQ